MSYVRRGRDRGPRSAARAVGLAGLFLLLAASSGGHDFWLEPSSYRLAVGSPLTLAFREGHGEGQPLPRNSSRLRRFVLHGPSGEQPITGVDGAHPAGLVPALGEAGIYVAAYRNTPGRSLLPAERFESYLREKGLERISEQRAARGEAGTAGRERFSRCAKAVLVVGEPASRSGFDRRLGLPLELVPESDPTSLQAGGSLSVRLWFRDRPLAGAQVVAVPREVPEERQTLRTDADGRVRFPVDRGGRWLIEAVHMEAAPAGSEVDWESWWASLVFLPEPGAGNPPG